MDANSSQNSAGDGLMKNKRRKKKANKTDEQLNMNQMDDNLEVPDIDKICNAANNDLQNNLMELDSTARSQSQAEQSKMVTKPIELRAGWTVLRKKEKREHKKKEAKIEGELQSVDRMDDHLEVPAIGKLCNDLQNKLIELDSTADLPVEQSKVDTRSTENIAEGTVLSKNKKRKKKKKAKNEGELQSVDRIDDHYIGKICTGAISDLQNNIIELDSAAKLPVEQSKMDTRSIENISEGTMQTKKRKRKKEKKKAKNEGELKNLDQMSDHLEVPAIGTLCIVANSDLQNNLIELNSTAQRHVEQSKMDTRSTENITEGTVQRKKREKKENKKKAKSDGELQNADQMDDHLEAPVLGKLSIVAINNLQNNLIELDLTAQLPVEQSKMDTRSTENITEGTVLSENKKRKQKKKKAKKESELQSVDQMDDHDIGKICTGASNDVQSYIIELDSTAQLHVEQSKMDARSIENISEGIVQRKKRKQKKKMVKNEGKHRSVDQMDDHMEAPTIGNLCIVANNDLQNNLIVEYSAAKCHVEQSKMDTRSSENITEGTVEREKREKKQKKKKSKNEGELQSIYQMDNHLEAPVLDKLSIVANSNNGSQNNLTELDSTAQLHMEQSKMDTRSTENITEGTVQRKKREKKQKKKKSKNEGELQSVYQMDNHLEAPVLDKLSIVANNDLQNNLIELDSTAQLDVEQSKMDTRSTENITEGTELSKNNKRKQKKKKAKKEGELPSVDQMDDHDIGKNCTGGSNDLQNYIIELDSIAQSHLEQSKMDATSTENISERTVQRKKRKQKTKMVKNEGEHQSEDQMDDHLGVPTIGKLCIVANNDLQNNLIEEDSTAKWHVERSKMDTRSTENITEGTVQRKKREKKQKEKKSKNEGELQSVYQMDDHLDAPALDKLSIVADSDLQDNFTELDSTAQLHAEETKMGTRSTENLSEGIPRRKRRKQNEKRANTKDEHESADIMSNLNFPDASHGVGNGSQLITNESTTSLHLVQDAMGPVGLNKSVTPLAPVDFDSKSYSEFHELGSAPMDRPRDMEVEMFSCESQHINFPCEMSSKNEKLENEFSKEENIVYQGKDFAACSSCDVEVTKHLFSPILKEEHLSNDSFLGIAPVAFVRRKLLVLDVNGLLADIVLPAPKDRVPDTRIMGRAVFRRPFCNDFLKFCFEKFDVAIWSSRSKRVIDPVVNYLLGNLRRKLLFCWDMSQSTQTSFKTLENQHKPLVMKELKKIWEKYDPRLPWEKGYYNESNTLLLDDSPYKALLNPLHTAIFPYSYHYKDKGDNSLGPGGSLRVYLEDMLKCEDVKKYVEQHPFGQGAIDETNISWSFYSRVLQSVSAKSF